MKRISKAALAATFALVPLAAGAITLLPPCTATGDCGISDILAVFINLAEFLLGIVGAVALGYFVYGGFVFILSRGNKGEVDRAFGILRSAAIGMAIIFLSGVLVRFTTRALTGGVSAIPTVGESCDPSKNPPVSVVKGTGLWISIPSGVNAEGRVVPESLECVKKENNPCKDGTACKDGKCVGDKSDCGMKDGTECANLNAALQKHGRTEVYKCISISSAKNCVRGLCLGTTADLACCLQ
jgi:cbb3-type cytochrome oxidase subunit 3